MPELRIEATVNGRKISRAAKPWQRLLDFIRDDLGLTGNKEGCGAGECGTCSVFIDGVLMKSCLVPVAKAQGATIETVESLAQTGELSVLQQAFHKMGASQCGYCIPGMVMARLRRCAPIRSPGARKSRSGSAATSAAAPAIRKYSMRSNSRATSITDKDPQPRSPSRACGRRLHRRQRAPHGCPSKVSGSLRYAGDMVIPHMLHMQVLRSPHRARPHRFNRYVAGRGRAGRRGRHHLRRCAGRGWLRCLRQRSAGHGARKGALRR